MDGTPLTEFAADLRLLRQKAGSPTYRKLAGQAHYSATTLSDAAGGRQLPTLAVTIAYVRACDGDVDEWEQRWHALAAELNVSPLDSSTDAPAGDAVRAPYLGLSAYSAADADLFFGRERLVDEVVTRLGERRFVALFGASGSGKSSLLRAGLLPRLGVQPTVLFTPGPRPMEECAVRLAHFAGRPASEVGPELNANPANLHLLVRQALVDRPGELVLVVDQFEEVFTLCRDADERSRFISTLVAATSAGTSRCRVVLGVRADFFIHCSRNGDLVDALRDAQLTVGPLTGEELRSAITRPATHAGFIVETALLTTLVTQGHDRPGVLPLLSHALLETWRRRRGTTLTLDGYHASGGINGALANTAERVFESLDDEQRQAGQDLFLRLTALGEGTEDTKRRIEPRDLDGQPHAATVIEQLAAARLVVLTEDGIEITHEALIGAWPRLRGWLTTDRADQRAHRELTDAATVWEQHRHDPGALLRGVRLAVTKEWHQRTGSILNSRERALFDASVAAERREQATVRRRNRVGAGLVVLLAVASVATTVIAIKAIDWQRAAIRERDAARAATIVRESARVMLSDARSAAALSVAAYELAPSIATRETLIANTAAATVEDWPEPAFRGAADPASFTAAARFGTSRNLEADSSSLWDLVSDDRVTTLSTMRGGAQPMLLSADARIAATVDHDAVVRLWGLANPAHPAQLAILPRPSAVATFSGNGRMMVTYDAAGPSAKPTGRLASTARLWDLTDPGRPKDRGLFAGLNSRFISARGRDTLVSIGREDVHGEQRDNMLRFWDTQGTAPPARVTQFASTDEQLATAALTPDKRLLVTGGEHSTLAVWDVTDPRLERRLDRASAGHEGGLGVIAMDASGHLLATSGRADDKVKVWRIGTNGRLSKLFEFSTYRPVTELTFSPDGQTLLGHTEMQSHNGFIWRWHLDAARARTVACGPGFSGVTRSMWAHYLPDLPYKSQCDL